MLMLMVCSRFEPNAEGPVAGAGLILTDGHVQDG